jgi:hypothetical protein
MVALRERAQAGLLDGSAADAAAGAAAAAVAAGRDGDGDGDDCEGPGADKGLAGAVSEAAGGGGVNQLEQRALRNLVLLGLRKVKVRGNSCLCD